MPAHPFADIRNRGKKANHNQKEAGIVMAQNRERQRKRKQRQGAESRPDTVMLTVAPFKVGDALKQFHPHKKEILNVVRILNIIGAKHNIIAAALDLQGWKTFYGGSEWTEKDVKGLLEGYSALQ
jgi:hypothetical protein